LFHLKILSLLGTVAAKGMFVLAPNSILVAPPQNPLADEGEGSDQNDAQKAKQYD
jgi:hypothetical protein